MFEKRKTLLVESRTAFDEARKEMLIEETRKNAEAFGGYLNHAGITNARFVIIGNSFSTYSMSDWCLPFFDQFRIIRDTLESMGINTTLYNFGLIRNNTNEKILEVLSTNMTLKEAKEIMAYDLCLNDASTINKQDSPKFADVKAYVKQGILPRGAVRQEDFDEYFKINPDDDKITILDVLKSNDTHTQVFTLFGSPNTGELADSITRHSDTHFVNHLIFQALQIILQRGPNVRLENNNLFAILKRLIEANPNIMTLVGAVPRYRLMKKFPIPTFGVVRRMNKGIKKTVKLVKTNTHMINKKHVKVGLLHARNGKLVTDIHFGGVENLILSNEFIKAINQHYLGDRLVNLYVENLQKHVERMRNSDYRNLGDDPLILALDEIFSSETKNDKKYSKEYLVGLKRFRDLYVKGYHRIGFPTDQNRILNQLDEQEEKLR